MSKTFVGFIFLILILVIVVLLFQINENTNTCKDYRISEQERLTIAAKSAIQSSTSNHPVIAHELSSIANFIIHELIDKNGGIELTENRLSLEKGKLHRTKEQIEELHQRKQAELTHYIQNQHRPDLDYKDLNDEAGFSMTKKKKNRKSH